MIAVIMLYAAFFGFIIGTPIAAILALLGIPKAILIYIYIPTILGSFIWLTKDLNKSEKIKVPKYKWDAHTVNESIPAIDAFSIPKPVTFSYKDVSGIPEYGDIRNTPLWFRYKIALISDRGRRCNRFLAGMCEGQPLRLHHIILVKNGGSNRPENLEIVCRLHHAKEHDWLLRG